MKRLVLVRHGESRWNAEGRVQGHACAGLSSLGHAQARVTAAALAAAYPGAEVVSSDLQRATESAAPLAAELHRSSRTDPRLRERSFGDWEERLRDEIAVDDRQRWQRWLAGEDVIGEVGGETGRQLGERVAPVLEELLQATPAGEVTIVVTHGGTIWHGLHAALPLPIPTLGGVANSSVSELISHEVDAVTPDDLRGAPAVLDRWNEVAHLPVELRTAWRPRSTPADAPPVGR